MPVLVETSLSGAVYQDPGEIKREEYPGTHDVYTVPDKKGKTDKPDDHLPTYADPKDPETGELYAVSITCSCFSFGRLKFVAQ